MMRKMEAVRDRIMAMCGTNEPLAEEEWYLRDPTRVTRQWRRPLSLEEVAQMADTPEVRARQGRP
jgi:hypothetical protein